MNDTFLNLLLQYIAVGVIIAITIVYVVRRITKNGSKQCDKSACHDCAIFDTCKNNKVK